MPVRFRDYAIQTFTDKLQSSPTPKLTDQNVVELLSKIGDGRKSGVSVLAELSKPGITRQEQFDLTKEGLAEHERSDIASLLDSSGLSMDPGAKNFLEALIDRAPLQTTFGPLQIIGDQKNGIAGIAKAGETIEAINLSTAPAGRLHLTDTVEIGRADESGKFLGSLPDVREGDIIRLRTRAEDGSTSDWLTITATGVESRDTRNAEANLERMDLVAQEDGSVSVTANTARPITEPNATLRFTNTRTGETFDVKATENGSVPEGLKLKGEAGDTFSIAASDGKNNTDFRSIAGELKVPGSVNGGGGVNLPDPDVLKDDKTADGKPKFGVTRFTGPLFIDGPKPGDVRQGAIGDCYFPAALASIAHSDPSAIEDMIKDNGDGTYTVRFYESSYGSSGRPVEVKVDGDLYARSFGGPVYGGSLGTGTQPDKMELWFPLVEKAYAQWKGSYEAIGNGGISGKVMSEVMGAPNGYESIGRHNADRVWDSIKRGGEAGHPMTAGTYGSNEADKYTNTGVYANHAYSVLGAVEENGSKYVLLRNPWGQSEGGNDGKNDGFFRLELSEFVNLYQSWSIVQK